VSRDIKDKLSFLRVNCFEPHNSRQRNAILWEIVSLIRRGIMEMLFAESFNAIFYSNSACGIFFHKHLTNPSWNIWRGTCRLGRKFVSSWKAYEKLLRTVNIIPYCRGKRFQSMLERIALNIRALYRFCLTQFTINYRYLILLFPKRMPSIAHHGEILLTSLLAAMKTRAEMSLRSRCRFTR